MRLFFIIITIVLSAGAIPVNGQTRSADLNLLIITIDTLRPDRLGCYSQKYVKTPAIDALAARGILFQKAFAHTPETLPSHTNIFLGATPLYHGVRENSKTRVSESLLTLAEHLKNAGYATGAFVGAFPLDSRFGLNQGFDVYDDCYSAKTAYGGSYSERKAEQVIAPAMAWLSKQNGKWFCWVHLWDPHAPYLPPEPFLTRYKNDPYSGEAAYVDAQLKILFEDLAKKGWAEKTLVVLTADHGESLGEHGELTHSFFAYNSTLHVPLIMAGPGIRPSRLGDYVSHIDIFPTVSEILGLKAPAFLQGTSLAPLISGKKGTARPIYFEALEPYLNKGCAPLRGFIEGEKKYVDSPIPEFYDLAADFSEAVNLAGKADLSHLKKNLEEMEKRLAGPQTAGNKRPVDRQTIDRLRSLGYVASPVAQLKAKYGPEDDVKNFLPFQQKLEKSIILGDQGKTEESIQLLDALILDKKDFIPAIIYLAQIYVSQDRLKDALQVLSEGHRDNPENYSLLSAYGALLIKGGQWDQAVEVLQKALSIIDYDPEAWDSLGFAFWRKGDPQKALEYYQKAIALDGSFAQAYSNLGALYLSLFYESRNRENLTTSIDHFRNAVSLDPTLNLAFRGLGVASRESGKVDDAIGAWEKAVETDAADDFSTINLGLAYLEKGNKPGALKCFQRFLELRKDSLSPDERNRLLALIEKCR